MKTFPDVVKVFVIFQAGDGTQRLIRLTEQEEAKIRDKILLNRRFGLKQLMYQDVALLPLDLCSRMGEFIQRMAPFDIVAKSLQEEIEGKSGDEANEQKPEQDDPAPQ